MRNVLKNTVLFTSIFLVPVLGIYLLRYLPYLFVILGPDEIDFQTAPTIEAHEILINGEEIPPVQWKMGLGSVDTMFSDVPAIFLFGSGASFTIEISVNVSDPENVEIQNSRIIWKGTAYGGDIYVGEYTCNGVHGIHKSMQIKNANINYKSLKQRWEKIELQGEINLNNIYFPHNPDECKGEQEKPGITLDIDSLTIDLDSTLIYEWSPKGGGSYRL